MTREQRLRAIVSHAEKLLPQSEDDPFYYLIGGIRVNAEDALGAMEADKQIALLDSMLRGGIVMARG